MYPNLLRHIRRFVELSENETLVLHKYIKTYDLKKKEYLLKEGQVCKALYFVEKGCLRMFFINNKTTEQITQFALDGWWISDYFSFMDSKPSEYFIQTIEKSEVLLIDTLVFDDLLKELPQLERYFRIMMQRVLLIDTLVFDDLLKELPQLERYFRIMMQRALAASQLRTKYVYEMTKEEFYQHFSSSFPEFVQRVPQYMIASYLGLTPEYVSELRKKKL